VRGFDSRDTVATSEHEIRLPEKQVGQEEALQVPSSGTFHAQVKRTVTH
jgi:hypothetical protein